MSRKTSIVAFLQLGAACAFLFLGIVSIRAYSLIETILFEPMSWYGGPYGINNRETLSFVFGTIVPFAIGAIGLIFFYGNWMEIETPFILSLIINGIGICTLLYTFFPPLVEFQNTFSNPNLDWRWIEFLHSYDWYFSYLFILVPIALILSLITIIFSFNKDSLKNNEPIYNSA
ncbi:MAG: hypothetical protein ACFFF4_06665 [Candidatus Thorarchaeota archaeon]